MGVEVSATGNFDNGHLVFVYGTLKRGESRDLSTLPGIEAEFIGEVFTTVGILRDLGAFPGLFSNPEEYPINTFGELWEVNSLHLLDHIEGQRNGFYSRGRVHVFYSDLDTECADPMEAWTYFCIGVEGEEYPVVPGGNWSATKKE